MSKYRDIDVDASPDIARVTKLRIRILETGGPGYIIAQRAGFQPSRLSEYVLGKKAIPTKHLVRLCQVLQCDPDDIIGWAE